jgi:HAE1 family hydrophobic/amphiphilic exporter-1
LIFPGQEQGANAVNFSEVFIRRPIATSLLMAALALFGVVAYSAMPVSDMPDVEMPTLQVQANLPGADPATMASSVATVLERQFTTIAGIDSMRSTSSSGQTQITLQFDISRDVDGASVDVQTAIAEAMPLLPSGMTQPPSFRKQNPGDQPIFYMTLVSDTVPLSELADFAETVIAPRISMVNGVAKVEVQGAAKYAVRVQLDPDALVAKKIGINEVTNAINNWNPNSPTGTMYGPRQAYTLKLTGQLQNAQSFGNLIIAWRDGRPVRLNEVADVIDSVENDMNAAWMYTDGKMQRAVQMQVMKQPGANTIQVADAVKALFPSFEAQLPPSVALTTRGDRSTSIRAAFRDIQFTMGLTVVLVVVVIFLFLRNPRATLIPALALPFCILGTIAVMKLCGFSLNTLSMMALILSVVFVVDDAIVMLENIVRHIEAGLAPLAAAFRGSREIGFTILSMTVSLAAVFIPILFMSGMLGRIFKEFAVTICVAILVSGLVSVTLSPMLASKLLRPHQTKHNWLYRVTERGFQGLLHAYAWTLRGVLRARPLMLAAFFGVIAATYYLYGRVPKGFIPTGDADQMQINLQAAQGTSFYKMVEYQQKVAEIVRRDPDVETFMTNAGNSNNARFFMMLKPDRKATAQQIAERLRPQLARIPGVSININIQPPIRIGGGGFNSRSNYDLTLQGPDTEELYASARLLEEELKNVPEIMDVNSDLEFRSPQIRVDIDRERAALYGLNPSEIANALYGAYGPRNVSMIYSPKTQYRVIMEVQKKYQAFSDYLSKISFKTSSGALVPLDSLAKVTETVGPQSIAHAGQLPAVTLSFNLRPGVALGDVVEKLQAKAKEVLPGTVAAKFSGNAAAFQDSLQNLSLLFVISVLVVYIVLGVLYESYIHPLTILSGLPSACLGALLTLWWFGSELNIYSFVGLIILVGVVKKNAIMQIDFALAQQRAGAASPSDAIYRGCLIRFRPIMMTTMAAMLGAIPIALGSGPGGEARRPLGLTVLGGLGVSQIMTLYLTPVIYTYMARITARKKTPSLLSAPEPSPGFGD